MIFWINMNSDIAASNTAAIVLHIYFNEHVYQIAQSLLYHNINSQEHGYIFSITSIESKKTPLISFKHKLNCLWSMLIRLQLFSEQNTVM